MVGLINAEAPTNLDEYKNVVVSLRREKAGSRDRDWK
jgi:hypothetical protein